MRLWENTEDLKKSKTNQTQQANQDAEDFYVFIYEEEDKSQFK